MDEQVSRDYRSQHTLLWALCQETLTMVDHAFDNSLLPIYCSVPSGCPCEQSHRYSAPCSSKIRKRRSPRRIYLELPHHAESISKHPWCQGNLVIEEKGKVSLPGSLAMKQPLTDSVLPSSREGSPAWLPKSLPVVSPRMSGQIHNATDGTGSLRLEEHIGPREDSELDSEEGGTPFHVKL